MLADRVKETTATTGTGTITLAGAAAGFQAFSSAFSTGTIVDYFLVSGTAWESGRGTFTTAGNTLSRDEVYSSSAAGAKITLSGTSDVFVSPSKTAFDGKQQMHGFYLSTAAPSEITNGLRRLSLDNGQNVDLAYDSSTRTLTITQTGGVVYWFKGQKVTLTSPVTVTHSVSSGNHYLYFADTTGTVTDSGTAWNLFEVVPIAEVYWDATNSNGTAWDERHNAHRDVANHSYLHNTQGARWSSGGVLSGYVIDQGDNTGVQVSLTAATIFDEDIRVATTTLAAGGPYTIWYKSGGNWTFDTSATVPWRSGTYVQYNNAGTMTDIAPGDFVNYYIYGTTSLLTAQRVILHPGQAKYTNLGDALVESLSAMDFTGFPSPETTPMYRLTIMADTAATTTGDGVIVDVTRLYGDKNFNPGNNPTNRSPDHVDMGRMVAAINGLQTWI